MAEKNKHIEFLEEKVRTSIAREILTEKEEEVERLNQRV
jgi:hypothetical protein